MGVGNFLASGCGGESGKSREPETVAESEKDEKPDSKEQKEKSNQDKSENEAKNKESGNSKKINNAYNNTISSVSVCNIVRKGLQADETSDGDKIKYFV